MKFCMMVYVRRHNERSENVYMLVNGVPTPLMYGCKGVENIIEECITFRKLTPPSYGEEMP